MDYNSFRSLMCQSAKQDLIVPCMLKLMQKWNVTTCTEQDRQLMASRGGQILAFMENVCTDPCEGTAIQTLIQCFAAVQVDPTPILHPNATIISDKYSIIGNNSDSAKTFCNSRTRLFSCLAPLSNSCPSLINRLYLKGVDLEAMERSTDVLCKDIDQYTRGLQCFTQPLPATAQCQQQSSLFMLQVLEERFRIGSTKPSDFMSRLCQTRLSHVDCELKAYGQSCDVQLISLRSTVECTTLPRPCRETSSIKPVFDSLCKTVTTPSPAATVRPTQAPSSNSGGSQSGGNSVSGAVSGPRSTSSRLTATSHIVSTLVMLTCMALL
ncbi:uncharacterized protein LOC112558017 [Pomacea canaliculata]|nr:uncharacterized protein LOC112558017 [Pomacea canaliculata]